MEEKLFSVPCPSIREQLEQQVEREGAGMEAGAGAGGPARLFSRRGSIEPLMPPQLCRVHLRPH